MEMVKAICGEFGVHHSPWFIHNPRFKPCVMMGAVG